MFTLIEKIKCNPADAIKIGTYKGVTQQSIR